MGNTGKYWLMGKIPPDRVRRGVLIMLSLSILVPTVAQTEISYGVKWIAVYPDNEEDKKMNFGDRVSRIVLGKKEQDVIKPFSIQAIDPLHFWILDQGAAGVYEVQDGRGSFLKSLKKSGLTYPSLVGLCRTKEGDLLFSDSRLNRVLVSRGGEMHIFGDSLALQQPTGLACDPGSGNIWIVETAAHRISQFDRDGLLLSRLGGRGTGPGQFNFPTFIWIDKSGRIYVVDSLNHRIQMFNSNGDFLGSFGEAGDASGYMARPKGVATDSKGHIYVADALFHVVQIFDEQGRFLHSFGNQGQGRGEFWMPTGIYIDEQDRIYVADSYNARVQIFKVEKQ